MPTGKRQPAGVTVVELLVVMTVAALVAAVSLTLYTGTCGFISGREKDAAALDELVLARKRVAAVCSRLTTIVSCNEREVVARAAAGDSTVRLHFNGTALTANADTLASALEDFRFSVVDDGASGKNRTVVLLWEGLYGKKRWWFGGGVALVR